jgi:hypothetical protein
MKTKQKSAGLLESVGNHKSDGLREHSQHAV